MNGVLKQFRHAIFNSLNGNISVPVYDEKKKASANVDLYVLFSTQQSSVSEFTQTGHIRRVSIDLEVVEKTGVEVSKDHVDDVFDEIVERLFPDYQTFNVTSDLQIHSAYWESEISRVFEISYNQSIVRNIIKITALIVQ